MIIVLCSETVICGCENINNLYINTVFVYIELIFYEFGDVTVIRSLPSDVITYVERVTFFLVFLFDLKGYRL